MTDSFIEDLKRHEGFRAKPYFCSEGHLTFGYGFTFLDEDEAEVVLKIKAEKYRKAILHSIKDLSPNRQNVLINMAFNLGITGLYKFRNMWAAIRAEDYDLAAKEMLDSRWARQVKGRAKELAQKMREG